MDDAVLVCPGQPRCDLAGNLQTFFHRQPCADPLPKSDAFVKGHGDEHVPA